MTTVATALKEVTLLGCQAFVTNDKRLRPVTELKILVLDELLP